MADSVRVTKRNIGSVICAQAGTPDCDAMTIAFATCEIEDVANDHIFVRVVSAHPIGRMNRLVVKTLQIDRVGALDGDSPSVDVSRHGTNPGFWPKRSISNLRLSQGVYHFI